MSRGLFVVATNCADPAREAEFNAWYNDVHIPDILALPGFVAATRYRLVGQPGQGQGKFLVLYEIEADDPAAVIANLWKTVTTPEWRARGRGFDGVEQVYVAAYRPITDRITQPGPSPTVPERDRAMSGGVFIVGSNIPDPSREAEISEWYNSAIVPDVVGLPGFIAGTRYQIIGQPSRNEGRYLALYEIEASDIPAVAANLWQAIDRWRVEGHGGRRLEGLELVYTAVYEAITGRITA